MGILIQTKILRLRVSSFGMKMTKSVLRVFWLLKQTSLVLLYLHTNNRQNLYPDLLQTAQKFLYDEHLNFFVLLVFFVLYLTAYLMPKVQECLDNLKWIYCPIIFKEWSLRKTWRRNIMLYTRHVLEANDIINSNIILMINIITNFD